MFTDGKQTKDIGPYTPLLVASQPLKDKGVNIISLGIGNKLDIIQLQQMASSKESVFTGRNLDDLIRMVTEITESVCASLAGKEI